MHVCPSATVTNSSENANEPAPSNPTEGSPAGASALETDGLTRVGRYPDARDGFEHGLVVLSMGLAYWLVPEDGGYSLLIETSHCDKVLPQLASYDKERLHWPPPQPQAEAFGAKADFLAPLLWAVTVCAAFAAQEHLPRLLETWGALNNEALFVRGEFWRPFTALFLHADTEHLLSNVFFGVPIFSLLAPAFGRAKAWWLLFAASYGGNLAAAALHGPTGYSSLGASTALFAALGLFTGKTAARALRHPDRRRAVLIPCAAGLALLAILGSEGHRTDLAAHACGFAAGILTAWLAAFGFGGRSTRTKAP